MALMLITHDFGVVAATCDAVQVMYGGRLVERGPVAADARTTQPPVHGGAAPAGSAPRRRSRARPRPIPGNRPSSSARRRMPIRTPLRVRGRALRARGPAVHSPWMVDTRSACWFAEERNLPVAVGGRKASELTAHHPTATAMPPPT